MRHLTITVLVFASLSCYAQQNLAVTFGKVTAQDFDVAILGADSSADAVVISDVGIRTFDPEKLSNNWDGYLHRTKRIFILKKRGFEAATVTIPLENMKTSSEEITG